MGKSSRDLEKEMASLLYTSLSTGNPIRNDLSHWLDAPCIPIIISSQLGKTSLIGPALEAWRRVVLDTAIRSVHLYQVFSHRGRNWGRANLGVRIYVECLRNFPGFFFPQGQGGIMEGKLSSHQTDEHFGSSFFGHCCSIRDSRWLPRHEKIPPLVVARLVRR